MQSRSLTPGFGDSRAVEVAFDRDLAILRCHALAGLNMLDNCITGLFQKPDDIRDFSFLLGHGFTVHFQIQGRPEAAQNRAGAFESV
jgi:hypothetical protein